MKSINCNTKTLRREEREKTHMKNFKSRLFVTSATLAAIGFMATANPIQANATEYTSSTWTARTADQIKADIQNLESGSKYTFQWGDTLSAIAVATDVSVNALVDVNSIGNADMIIAGNAIVLSADHKIVTVEQDSEVKSYDISSEEAVEVETPVEAVEAKAVKNLPYSALFKGKLLKRTICGSLVLIGMNTIQYTLMNWMPSLLSSLGYDTSQSQFMTMFGLFGAPFGIFLASLYMDKVPRKATGVILLIAMAVMGIITSKQTTMTALIASTFVLNTFIYMYVCYASAVYVPEMWPTSAKLSGSGFCNAMGRVSNIFFPFLVTSVAAGSMGSDGVFVLISAVAVIIAVSIIVFGVETRGESVEDIGNIE